MSSYGKQQEKAAKFQSKKQATGASKNSIKKLAVLFTDIVASSKYFKVHGDLAGRRMLQTHQDIATPAIVEHGGDVLKILGDSVMAYFLNSSEALKAAIKIQQRFGDYNRSKSDKEKILVRVCIHYGDGIVEDKDIYGDVVNMAAKFLPIAQGDQILISRQAKDQSKELPSIHYQPINLPADNETLRGLEIFQVIWKQSVHFDSLAKNLIYIRPILNLARQNFSLAWGNLIKEIKQAWGGKIEKENILADKSHVLIIREPSLAVTIAKHTIDFLRLNLGWEGAHLLPVQVVLDRGSFLRANRVALDDFKVNWEKLDPGEIYLSATAYEAVKEYLNPSMSISPVTGQPKSFYLLSLNNTQAENSHLFLYQSAMIQGTHTPCFYCGDQRHANVDCPSKQFTEITNSFNRLGYISLQEINSLFFNYLTAIDSNQRFGSETNEHLGTNSKLAHNSFYDLKAVYQLRFLRALWESNGANWNQIKEKKAENRDQGGMLWIGMDCIRVGNLDQAKSILTKSLEKQPEDFRVQCLMAFYYIDREDFNLAKIHLKEALSLAKTTPRKIFALFLLQRIAVLKHDTLQAEKGIRNIINLFPFCSEAIYQGILLRFKKDEGKSGLQQLIKLISRSREFFVVALIDPELANYSNIIHPKFEDMIDEVKEEANIIKPKAAVELENLIKLIGTEDRVTTEAQSLMAKIEELAKSNSYFGYLDMIQYGESIINLGSRIIDNRRNKISRSSRDIKYRINACQNYIKDFPFKSMAIPVSSALRALQRKLDKQGQMMDSDDPEQFRQALPMTQEFERELYDIENRLIRLDSMSHFYQFLIRFFKRSFFLQSANLLVGLIVFPIITHYLSFILPDLQISPHNIWGYQKMVMILGGILSVVLAMATSPQKSDKHFHPAREVTV